LINRVTPSGGPTSGGDVVRLEGTGFATRVAVLFGGTTAEVLGIHGEVGRSLADIRTPAHGEGAVDVVLRNLDPDGAPVPGDVRAFTWGFVVRGFDIDEGLPLDLGRAVLETELDTEVIPTEGH
jgi:hypothetical protein